MADKHALIRGIISGAAEATTRFDSSVAVDPNAVSFLANQTRADELDLDDADKLKIFAAAVSVFSTVAATPSHPSLETVDASAYLVRTVDVEAMMRFVLPWPWNTSSKASSDVSKQPATTVGDSGSVPTVAPHEIKTALEPRANDG